MNKLYFTSDTHFGHANVIKYCNRPFTSVEEMDSFIINRWNDIVLFDTVYFLGDFALGTDKEVAYCNIVPQLQGEIIFLKGNHDRAYGCLNRYFRTIQPNYILVYKGYHFILSHYPLPNDEIPTGFINIHGHIHNSQLDLGFDKNYHINVSQDANNFTPICVDSIIEWCDKELYVPKSHINKQKEEVHMRKLATIEEILDIQPIENADAIEVATIKGWQVVVQKNSFKIGEKVVYFEIDSLIPNTSVTDFLMKNPDDKQARLRTIKLRGQVSQGLVIPLGHAYTMNKELNGDGCEPFGESIGTDLSDILHIEKYEPEIKDGNEGKSIYWPFTLPKTDEERIQNIPEVVDKINEEDIHLCISVKLDGTSMTVIHKLDGVHVAGRNNDFIKEDEIAYKNKYWTTALKYNIPMILERYHEKFPNKYLAVQGELVGPGIQNNKMNLSEREFYVFNLFESTDNCGSWNKLGYNELIDFCDRYGIKHVPYIYSDYSFKAHDIITIDDVLKLAEGTYKNDAEGYFPNAKENQQREGLVFRTLDHKYSFKAVNNLFLLKGGE